eukprot:Plantae.Rhodophyta-Hildenbrandia_rubra.ctg18156.p1 GENE.Plantae.Rhodophyta-Hildenbrandia_rubra.ctg18156~~Plantae.Rhodophyta-Hildenbrandia_rubra.ctg18156.p1  ORF type:complete len:720 (+),score=99.32 Plantae.Rhodophyta-Hildenbrandia_rubra.ctg18156:2406-4565(+)
MAENEKSNRRIRRLSPEVANRIAAGEVVIRPSAALKEILENSIDAGATSINVTVRGGGLKLLQIHDNGQGIHPDDFPLLCERFATSKITTFDDLREVRTFGFRGEALASISQVARLTIVSMVPGGRCAYRGLFVDGVLKEGPTATAGVKGTIITVEDLFYNLPTRLRAMRPPSEEYRAILDVVVRYSIKYSGIAMSCKKSQDGGTANGADLVSDMKATVRDNLRSAFGTFMEREMLDFKVSLPKYEIEADASCTNANYHMKRALFILFINGRLVDCSPLKRALDAAYSAFLPKKTHGFVYLDVTMKHSNVDVNIHPTKKEVRFLHEAALIDATVSSLTDTLKTAESSRTYYAQSLLTKDGAIALPRPNSRKKVQATTTDKKGDQDMDDEDFVSLLTNDIPKGVPKKPAVQYDKDKVRTDSRLPIGSMDAYLSRNKRPSTAVGLRKRRKRRPSAPIMLTSIKSLLDELEQSRHLGLAETLKEHVFVGIASEKYAIIQHRTKLLLADIPAIVTELMYRQILMKFADLDSLAVEPRAPIADLLNAYIGKESGSSNDQAQVKICTEFLLSHAAMLEEYFAIRLVGSSVDTAYVERLPAVFPGMTPELKYLPRFLFRVATKIDWSEETSCLQGISRELAEWYGVHWNPYTDEAEENGEAKEQSGVDIPEAVVPSDLSDKREWTLHHVLFASLRFDFDPPQHFASDGIVREITSTARLYRIFERC